jgi:hypothetical protein
MVDGTSDCRAKREITRRKGMPAKMKAFAKMKKKMNKTLKRFYLN